MSLLEDTVVFNCVMAKSLKGKLHSHHYASLSLWLTGCQGFSQSTADEKVNINELNHGALCEVIPQHNEWLLTSVVEMHKHLAMGGSGMCLFAHNDDRQLLNGLCL